MDNFGSVPALFVERSKTLPVINRAGYGNNLMFRSGRRSCSSFSKLLLTMLILHGSLQGGLTRAEPGLFLHFQNLIKRKSLFAIRYGEG